MSCDYYTHMSEKYILYERAENIYLYNISKLYALFSWIIF